MFTCGAVLIAWSFNQGQQSLWNVGAPLALAGQVAFLVGLVLQLDVLWQQTSLTSQAIQELDHRLPGVPLEPQLTGAKANVGPNSPSAPGNHDANSLLTDLKCQLDRVATRLSRS